MYICMYIYIIVFMLLSLYAVDNLMCTLHVLIYRYIYRYINNSDVTPPIFRKCHYYNRHQIFGHKNRTIPISINGPRKYNY